MIVHSAIFLKLLFSSSSLTTSSSLLLKRYEKRAFTSSRPTINLLPRLFIRWKSIDMTKRNIDAINLNICSRDEIQEVKRGSLSSSSSSSSSSLLSLTRDTELKYYKSKNHVSVFGVDEAGRGPLAGPVVVAACYIKKGIFIPGINDSKQTKEHEREYMYEVLVNHPDVLWSVSEVSHTEIDDVNILQATMNGMRRSSEELLKNLNQRLTIDSSTNNTITTTTSTTHIQHEYIALVDGNRIPTNMPVHTECIIKGDSTVFSIAAASIIAKVTRDRIMLQLHQQYPIYNLAQHKGYPTAEHRSLLLQHGPCEIHRRSYAPVRRALELIESKNLQKKNINSTGNYTATCIVDMTVKESGSSSVEVLSKKRSSRSNCKSIQLKVNKTAKTAAHSLQVTATTTTTSTEAIAAINGSNDNNHLSLRRSSRIIEKKSLDDIHKKN